MIDRPPVAFWRHFPVDDQSAQALAEAHLDFQRRYDFDLVKVTPASSFSVLDWGVEDTWEGNTEGTRTYTRSVIREPRDWEALTILQPDAPHLAEQLICLSLIRQQLPPDTPLLQTVFNPLAQAKHLAGEAVLMRHLKEAPQAVEAGLKTIAESTSRFIRAAAGVGIDGIFYAVQHAQAALMTPADFIHLSREADMMLLRDAGDLWCNVLHVHGQEIFFDAVSSYPAQIINWHDREAGPSLEAASRKWSAALCGGLSRHTLVYGTPPDIYREATSAISGSHGSRRLLSTGCVVPIIVPHGNLVAARQAARAASPDRMS